MTVAIRVRVNHAGELELIDPLPTDLTPGQELVVITDKRVYLNEFGVLMINDRAEGIEYPLVTPTHAERLAILAETEPLDISDPLAFVRQLRNQRVTPDEANDSD